MAHFAKLGLNSKVIDVVYVNNSVILDNKGVEQETIGIDFLIKITGYFFWKQTSYNNNFRKNYAGIGMTYDEDRDAFIPKKQYNSWILNEQTCQWEAPTPKPNDGKPYIWNENIKNWDLISLDI